MEIPDTQIPAEALAALQSDEAFRQRAQEVRAELQEQKQERTETGRRSKTAKQAEQAEELMQALHPVLEGLNDMLRNRWPGVEYTPGQVEFIATIGGKIASKYVDLSAEKYAEEITLALFLLTTGAQKGVAIYQEEKRRRIESERPARKSGAEGSAE